MAENLNIPIIVNADGVAPGVSQTVDGLKKVQAETAATGAAGQKLAADTAAAAAAAQKEAADLAAATAAAQKWGVSLDVARAALVSIKREEFASEVEKIKARMQGASGSSVELRSGLAGVAEEAGRFGQDAAESGERFNISALGNVRSVRHLLNGLLELEAGGTAAIGGLAAEGRVATEVFDGMLGPLAPLALAITTITMLAAPMIEKWTESREKMDDGKQAADDWKAAIEGAGEAAKKTVEAATGALRSYLEIQTQVLKQEEERAAFEQQGIKDLEARTEATTKLSLATLELQKQEELGSAKSQKEKDAIEARYKAREAEVTGASADQKYGLEKQALSAQESADTDEKSTRQSQVTQDEAKLEALRRTAARTAQIAQSWGDVQPDALGSYADPEKAQEKVLEDAKDKYLKAQSENAPTGQLQALQQGVTIEGTKLADIRDAESAQSALKTQGSDLEKSILSNKDALEKVDASLEHLASALTTAEINHDAGKQKEVADAVQAQQKAEQKTRDDDAATRKAERDGQITATQTQIDTLPPGSSQRGPLEQKIAGFKHDQLEDEKYGKIYAGEIEDGSPEAKLYDLKAGQTVAATNAKVGQQNTRNEDDSARQQLEAIKAQTDGHKEVGALTHELTQLTQLAAAEQGKVNAATVQALQHAIATVQQQIAELRAHQGKLHDQVTSSLNGNNN